MPPMLALSIAIVCEVIATSYIPKTEQFTKVMPSTVVLIGYGIAFFLLSVTVQTMPVGVVYAIWSGAGIVFGCDGWLLCLRTASRLTSPSWYWVYHRWCVDRKFIIQNSRARITPLYLLSE